MTAYDRGEKAFHAGIPLIHNPYPRYSPEGERWHEGWKNEWWRTATWRPR